MSRDLPKCVDSERSVLGGLILDSRWYHEVSAEIGPEDFSSSLFSSIFKSIGLLVQDGVPVDPVTIADKLTELKYPIKGKAMELASLTDACPAPSNSLSHARIVLDYSRRRQMIIAANEVSASGFDTSVPTDDYIAESQKRIADLSQGKPDEKCRIIVDDIDKTIAEVTSGGPKHGMLKTLFHSLDSEFGGLPNGVMTVLGARPGMGKSTFLLNIGAKIGLAGTPCLFVSLEDTRYYIECRLISRATSIENMRVNRGFLTGAESETIRHRRDLVACIPMHIDDGGPYTADQVRRRVISHCMRHPCGLVMIDHLSHVVYKGKEYEELTAATKIFGSLPKQIGKPVLLAVQLNRELERRQDKRPTLSDLRSTGEIEQQARAVWFLYRDSKYNPEADPNELELIIAKSNHGKTGSVKLWIDESKMTIEDARVLSPMTSTGY